MTNDEVTDADKLRNLAINLGDLPAWAETVFDLRRIADLLDAVPPETIRALGEGTMVAVSKELLKQMADQRLSDELEDDEYEGGDFVAGYDAVVTQARIMLAAAPAKPEDGE